ESHQKRAWIDVTGDGFAVHRQCDGGHGSPPRNSTKGLVFAPAGGTGGGSGQDRGDLAPGCALEQVDSEPAAHRRSRAPGAARAATQSLSSRLRHGRSEFDEEVVGGLLRRAVDQTLAELGELAADLRLHVIGEKRAAVLAADRPLGAAFAKPRRTALPFAGNAIAVRRIKVGETDLALPARLDGADFDGGDGLEFAFRNFVELLAAWDAALEHLGIVELGPYHLAARGELNLPVHGHRHGRFSVVLKHQI